MREQAIKSGLPASKVDTIIKKAVADADAAKDNTFDRKDATTLEQVFERQGWQVRYNLTVDALRLVPRYRCHLGQYNRST